MNKEVLFTQIIHSVKLTKNFLSSNCNSLKEYLVKKNVERKNQGYDNNLGRECLKFMFFFLNVFYLLTALLILIAGATGQSAYLFYGLTFEYKLISISWIISGVVLLIVSIYGIVVACNNKVTWTKIYGVFMIVAFFVQLHAAIVGFTLISKSERIARHTLDRFIRLYSFFEPTTIAMDVIQKSLQCCGNENPNNWEQNTRYNPSFSNYYWPTFPTFPTPTVSPSMRMPNPNNWEQNTRYNPSFSNYYWPTFPTFPTFPTPTVSPSMRMPESCCPPGSGYQNLTCDIPFQKGCLDKMYEITLQVILTIDSIALAIAVVQFVGILTAFIYAKRIRRTKSYKAAHTWKLQSNEITNGPIFVDYIHLNDNDQQLIQQVN